jgi:acid phosphatase family membrane protein YuiD
MEIFSPYIIAAVSGWVVAQVIKYILASLRRGDLLATRQLYLSGGMPSAHSATVTALALMVGLKDGWGSTLFALAITVASVVIYDSIMVRRASGEQGESLTALIKEQKSNVRLPGVAKGHTPLEALAGIVLGVAIALVVYFVMV